MDPQRLARFLDGRSALRAGAGTAGAPTTVRPAAGSAAAARSTSRVLPCTEPVTRTADASLGVAPDAAAIVGQDVAGPAAARRRGGRLRGAWPRRRPALFLAAALLGAAGLGLLTSGQPAAHAATPTVSSASEATSVAEELGLRRARSSVLSGDEAAVRLQEMVATRAEREDAQAAASQVQAAADQAAAAADQAAADAAAEAGRPKVVLPVDGARISSGFGSRWGTLHAGVDFAAPMGTPEYAAMDGVVLKAGAASGFGLAVYIQHADGTVTVYGHMDKILVEQGRTVRAGDTIALVGNRGQSTGPHLHLEVRLGGMDGQPVDPLPWLRERGVAV